MINAVNHMLLCLGLVTLVNVALLASPQLIVRKCNCVYYFTLLSHNQLTANNPCMYVVIWNIIHQQHNFNLYYMRVETGLSPALALEAACAGKIV